MLPELHVLYGAERIGKSTFIENYCKGNHTIISKNITPTTCYRCESKYNVILQETAIKTVNEILSMSDVDIVGIEIRIYSDSKNLYSCVQPFEYDWIKPVSNKFSQIFIHSFCGYIENLRDIEKQLPNVVYVNHNAFSILYAETLTKNTIEHFNEIYNNVIVTKDYIKFKTTLGYPDFIRIQSCGSDSCNYYNSSHTTEIDEIMSELFDLLSMNGFALPVFDFKQWIDFEKKLYFETCNSVDDYCGLGFEHTRYLSLPDLYLAISLFTGA